MATNEWDWGTVDTGTPTESSSIYGYNPQDDAGFDSAYNTQQAGLSGGGGGGSSFDLGGLFSSLFSGWQARKIAKENRKWQSDENTLAFERSLPWSSYGPAGNVEFDPETKQIISTLSPKYQDLMNQWLGTAGKSNTELQNMMNDPNKLAKSHFDLLQKFSADDYARTRMQGEEDIFARNMHGTESYYDKKAIEDSINKSILADKIASIGLDMNYRQMLGAETLGFGGGAMNIAGLLRPDAQLGINLPKHTVVNANMQGIREGGQDYADTGAAFWSGMLDQKAKYNTQGNATQEAQPGWLSQLISGGKEYYSALTDNTRNSNIA